MRPPRGRRVFVLDSHDIFRMGLRHALELEAHLDVVGEAADLADGFEQIDAVHPDVVVVGVREHEMPTIEALGALAGRSPAPQLLVLSRTVRREERDAAFLAGANAYLSKDVHAGELVTALDQLAAGEQVSLDRASGRAPQRPLPPGVAELTRQERRILDLIGQGHTNAEIGRELFLAEKTVRNHVTRILSKLGVRRRTQAALIAAAVRT